MEQQVDGLEDPVGPLGVGAGEGAELPQHDVDAHRGDEAGHDGRRHEAQQRATAQEPRGDHEDAGEHGEGEERPLGSGAEPRPASATTSDMAPVACTAMKVLLVTKAAPTMPKR